jgi:O-antigen ligase
MAKSNQKPSKFELYLLYGGVGLFAYMPFHIFFSQWLSTYTGGLEIWKGWKDVFTALLTILCIATVVWRRRYTKLYWWILGLTGVYGLLHVILIFATNQPLDTGFLATVYNLRIFAYLLIGYSLALLMPRMVNARKLAQLLIILSTIVCFIGFLQWILPKDLMTHFGYSIERGTKPNFFIDDKPDLPRVFSTIRDPNSLGAFLILPITMLAYALVRYWNTNRRMLLSGLLGLHGLILLLTFSRSALLATALSLSVLAVLAYKKQIFAFTKRFAIPLAILCIVTLGGAVALRDQYFVQNVIFHADESTTLDDPNELRVGLFQKSIDGVLDDPEGHGPGTAGLVSTKHLNGTLLTENYYLQIAYEVGVIGLLVFLCLVFLVLKQLWLLRASRYVQALLASFVGISLMGFLLHVWANEAVAIAWFAISGAFLNVQQKGRPSA